MPRAQVAHEWNRAPAEELQRVQEAAAVAVFSSSSPAHPPLPQRSNYDSYIPALFSQAKGTVAGVELATNLQVPWIGYDA